jgi:hypothetical protein
VQDLGKGLTITDNAIQALFLGHDAQGRRCRCCRDTGGI